MSAVSKLKIGMRALYAAGTATALLLLPQAGTAQPMDVCRAQCARDKDSSNATCPIATYESTADRDACFKTNVEAYQRCLSSCPPPEPAPEPGPLSNPVMNPTITNPATPAPQSNTPTGPEPSGRQPIPQPPPSGY